MALNKTRRGGGRKERDEALSYLGGGHESFNCVVMEVSAYTVPWQSATPWSPTPVSRAARLNV